VGQVLLLARNHCAGTEVNIVMMGQGEPLLNLKTC
jgi:adenine C2-methylase RlmN of 23S rRNA A2503 and tRNA A37